jgi:hypothetical protein
MRKKLLMLCLAFGCACCAMAVARHQALLTAKNLTITTKAGQTYYYIVSSNDSPMMYRAEGRLIVGRDTFLLSDIQSMRFRSMAHFLLDEDSTAFSGSYAVDHGLLALRRTMQKGSWNSLIVPVDMTAAQVLDAFGDSTRVATVRGMSDKVSATLDFETVDLQADPNAIAIKAGQHYLLSPSREPDYSDSQRPSTTWGSNRPYGPIYLVPNVSMASGQKRPKAKTVFEGTNYSSYIQASGAYYQHNVSAGNYLLNDEGRFILTEESVTQPGFTSCFTDHREDKTLPLRFYIDGINEDLSPATGIEGLIVNPTGDSDAIYDLHGRRLDAAPRKGIYVKNGKKFIVK